MKKTKALSGVAILFFVIAIFMYSKGSDKMDNYKLADRYYEENVNAYVNNDADNYIINANYTTAYFILSIGFLISGLICEGVSLIISAIEGIKPSYSGNITGQAKPYYSASKVEKSNDDNKMFNTEKTSITHKWRCDKCGKIINENDCPFCGEK